MRKPRHRPTDPCLQCMRHHEPPECGWLAEALCPSCGLTVWYKGDDAQPGPECYYCWSGFPRRVCEGPGPERVIEPDWVDGL